MKTGTGINIEMKHLTADFYFQDVVVPIGKFDPSAYDGTDSTVFNILKWNDPSIQQHVFDQLDDSGLMSDDQLETLSYMDPMDFILCIVER